jgi:hypothetical protein
MVTKSPRHLTFRIQPGQLMSDNADRRGLTLEMAYAMPDPENVLVYCEL